MSRNSKKLIREKMEQGLELKENLPFQSAILTVTGRREALIENYKGILIYEDSFIKIQTKNCRILIRGNHLLISYYTSEEMRITGFIDSISYEN